MAAGIIQVNITTVTGTTIPMDFWVDDTVSPTKYVPAHVLLKSDGTQDTSIATVNSSLTSRSTSQAMSAGYLLTALASDSPGVFTAGAAASTASVPTTFPTDGATTCATDITRPSDVNAYTANDAWADSTSSPTTGGFTLSNAARQSGGSGVIVDIVVVSSNDPATLLQGELWIFDSAPTAVNDNAAFALSDADAKKLVAVVPFTLATTTAGSGTNSFAHLQGLNIAFTCSGSANLRYLVKVKNAYTPASAEVLTVRAKVVYTA